MAIDFPSSPTDGQEVSITGRTFRYSAVTGVWRVLTGTVSNDISELADTTNIIPVDVSDLTDTTNLLTGFSGDYVNLTNKPTIPADVSDLTDSTSLLGSGGATVYANFAAFPVANTVDDGTILMATDTGSLYVAKGGVYYLIPTENNAPSFTLPQASYTLDNGGVGAATVQITLSSYATDPEGGVLTYSHSITGDTSIATIDLVDDIMTITPTTTPETDNGNATVSVTVSDGLHSVTDSFDLTLIQPTVPGGAMFVGGYIGSSSSTSTNPTLSYEWQWTCPAGVNSVCVVAIGGGGGGSMSNNSGTVSSSGGGGLGWKNNISVTPGQTYTVRAGGSGFGINTSQGARQAWGGGDSWFDSPSVVRGGGGETGTGGSPAGGTYTGDGGGNGGSGYYGNSSDGGGAAGYTGNGGGGSYGALPDANSGGGAAGFRGGGVSPYGKGTTATSRSGNGSYSTSWQSYGGGYGSSGSSGNSIGGGTGCVRIIWGDGRAFPDTNVATSDSSNRETVTTGDTYSHEFGGNTGNNSNNQNVIYDSGRTHIQLSGYGSTG